MVDRFFGKCKFCGNEDKLCNSHSIPNGIYRLIMKAGSGSAIDISSGSGKIRRTSDTGAAHLLCESCEEHFNTQFDAPIVNGLKLLDRKIQDCGFSARISFCHNQFAQAVAAIVWRCCESEASNYADTKLDGCHLAQLKHLLTSPRDQTLQRCSVRVDRLHDSSIEGFDQESISCLIVAPVPRSIVTKKGKLSDKFGFYFVIQGFLIHIIVPKLNFAKNRKPGFLQRGSTILHAPPTSMISYPPIRDILINAKAKYESGDVSNAVMKITKNRLQNATDLQSAQDQLDF